MLFIDKSIIETINKLGNILFFIPVVFILFAGVWLTLETRFIQVRAIKRMFKILFSKPKKEGLQTINPHKALFTAMSTTIGIATIVSPIAAISLGGPGALFYFLASSFLGGSLTFAEVTLALKYRTITDGNIIGGPMPYIKKALSPSMAKIYSIFAMVLLFIWTAIQTNTLADILVDYYVPTWISGIILAILIIITLLGGIKRIGNLSAKLVPLMFFLYSTSCLYIVFSNFHQLGSIFNLIFSSALSPRAILGGSAFGGALQALRWGFIKGIHSNEAGVGTSSIPHSMAEVNDPTSQGILAILGMHSQGFLCLLSGLVVLITGTWQDPTLRFGISPITKAFSMYFSSTGPIVLGLSTVLFGFGTVLGNAFYGSKCYSYATNKEVDNRFYVLVGLSIFLGAISSVRFMWSILPDLFLVMVAVPNILAILVLSFKDRKLLQRK